MRLLVVAFLYLTFQSIADTLQRENLDRLIDFVWKTTPSQLEIEGFYKITNLQSDTNIIAAEVNLLADRIIQKTTVDKNEFIKINIEYRVKSLAKNVRFRYQQLDNLRKLEETWLENPLGSGNTNKPFENEYMSGPDGFSTIYHNQNQSRLNTDPDQSKLPEIKLFRLDEQDKFLLQMALGKVTDQKKQELTPDWEKIQMIFNRKHPSIRIDFNKTNLHGINCHRFLIGGVTQNSETPYYEFILNAEDYNKIIRFTAPMDAEQYEAITFDQLGLPKKFRGKRNYAVDRYEIDGEFTGINLAAKIIPSDFKFSPPSDYAFLEKRGDDLFETINGTATRIGSASANQGVIHNFSKKSVMLAFFAGINIVWVAFLMVKRSLIKSGAGL
jgi:hypothetical protein